MSYTVPIIRRFVTSRPCAHGPRVWGWFLALPPVPSVIVRTGYRLGFSGVQYGSGWLSLNGRHTHNNNTARSREDIFVTQRGFGRCCRCGRYVSLSLHIWIHSFDIYIYIYIDTFVWVVVETPPVFCLFVWEEGCLDTRHNCCVCVCVGTYLRAYTPFVLVE